MPPSRSSASARSAYGTQASFMDPVYSSFPIGPARPPDARIARRAAQERHQRRVLAATDLRCAKDVRYTRSQPTPASARVWTCLPVEALPQPKRDLKYVE